MNKKIIWAILAFLILLGVFLYATRAPSAPSADIQSVTEGITAEGESSVYRISPEESTVTYTINEELRGEPNRVVGTSTQIAGDVSVSGNSVTVGTLKINGRTFVTDSELRDGAVARFVLKSENDENEFIIFEPSSVISSQPVLPESRQARLQVEGDLTIAGVTKKVVFTVTGMMDGEHIFGTASTTLKRSDFGLVIPDFDFIANVSDEFTVTADISAHKISQ